MDDRVSPESRFPPHPSPPPPPDLDKLEQTVQEAFQKIADSMNDALSTSSVTNRINRAVRAQPTRSLPDGWGQQAGEEPTWCDVLGQQILETMAEDPDLDSQDLDEGLIRVAAVVVGWIKDRNRRRKAAYRAGLKEG